MKKRLFLIPTLIMLLCFHSCGVNPVTGKKEIQFVSENKEVEIGKQSYAPLQQVEGGQYSANTEIAKYVHEVGQKLAKVSDRPNLPYEFVVLNKSVPNAWALPGGKISINRGLLVELNSEAELAAVLAHEIVHAAARHGAKGMERNIMLQVGVAALGTAAGGQYGDVLTRSASIGASMINSQYSQSQELEADAYGIKYMVKAGYDPKAAVKLQEMFLELSKNKKSNWLNGLFATHPPSQKRIDANKKTATKYTTEGFKGFIGKEKHHKIISKLINAKEAYEKLEEGKKALKEGKTDKALALAEKAIKIEPKESLFYALAGDAYTKKKNYEKALDQYNSAIKHNKNYFDLYLQRGYVNEKLNKHNAAKRDFHNSVKLLPTSTAYYSLGVIHLNEGDKEKAVKNLKIAAESDSKAGREARKLLQKL